MRQREAIGARHDGLCGRVTEYHPFHIGKTWKFILGKGVNT